ncbi:MAG: type VI secretion system tip protein VgrG [Bacteroidia bacterium]|nr:type VI secretion system tip protein VgrG [Bacteroidia bacterium]
MPVAVEGLFTHAVLVNGEELDATSLLEIRLNLEVNRIPRAFVALLDGDGATQNFELSNQDKLIPGAEITIQLGRDSDVETLFSGIVISHTIKVDDQGSRLEIECRDKAVKLTAGRKNKVFEDTTDADAIQALLTGTDVTAEITGLDFQHRELVQFHATNWDFIVSRAEANGALVIAESGALTIKAPDFSQTALDTFTFGSNIYEFEAKLDARNQYPKYIARTWDYTNQELADTEGEEPTMPEQGNLSSDDISSVLGWEDYTSIHTGKRVSDEATLWANAAIMRSRLNRITGTCKVYGDNRLKPGLVVNLQGVGDRFNGDCYVSGVLHSYNMELGWYTFLQLGYDKSQLLQRVDDVSEIPAAALLPAVNGLQIGLVTAIHDDPDGESRVKVKIPVIDNDGEGTWARLSSMDAGSARGWVWYPEIGDEVVVGFLNDDPRDAIILSRVYSSANAPHITPDSDNKQKGLKTKSELIVLFDDDKKTIQITTPAGNSISLDEDQGGIYIEDQNGNKVEMSSSAINIESAADLTIKATGDITIEGTNVTITANAQLKASGSGGAELSSSASTTVKGSTVMIN